VRSITSPQFDHHQRCVRPIQGSEGRLVRGESIRPNQNQKSGSDHQKVCSPSTDASFPPSKTEVRQIPPAAVGITFVIKEGPKVKVGKIKFEGNKNVKTRTLRYAMKNLRPIGIPHSIFLENIFARTYDATKLDEDTERVRTNTRIADISKSS